MKLNSRVPCTTKGKEKAAASQNFQSVERTTTSVCLSRVAQRFLESHLQMCFVCKKKGAAIKCQNDQCVKNFHLPCGQERGCLSQFFGEYKWVRKETVGCPFVACCLDSTEIRIQFSQDGVDSPTNLSLHLIMRNSALTWKFHRGFFLLPVPSLNYKQLGFLDSCS